MRLKLVSIHLYQFIPLRKFIYVTKVVTVLIFLTSMLITIDNWHKEKAPRIQNIDLDPNLDPNDVKLEAEVREDEARIIPGLGEGGIAAHLLGKAMQLGGENENMHKEINVHLSERIAYNRSLQDLRNPSCTRLVYDAELPSASVIIIFHNEPYSVVIRTVWSVINSARRDLPWYKKANFVDRDTGRTMSLSSPGQASNSTYVYLKEVILVDDKSSMPELLGKLDYYVRTRLPHGLVRIVRMATRTGLMGARVLGARYAAGDTLIFLDAHCEAQPDWLRPLLQRVKDDSRAVVMPVIDVIFTNTMFYSAPDFVFTQVGGFNFLGHYIWIEVPEREKKRRGSDIAPTRSPTMAGGLFAMDRAYFWKLGAYDEQMHGWGAENLEMSFRIWQCGGTLETIPCSRVGHIFRAYHPNYQPVAPDAFGINTARMAEVWMDGYKELFYLYRPDLRNSSKIGDISQRKALREKLQCKSFDWYLQHVYKEKFVPTRDAYGFGRFRNIASGLCLDLLQREGDGMALGVYPCHASLQFNQFLALGHDGRLRDEERCARLEENDGTANDRKLRMYSCQLQSSKGGHSWNYTQMKQLVHQATGLCLDSGMEGGVDVLAVQCRPGSPTQAWEIDYSEHNGFRLSQNKEPTEVEQALQKLVRKSRNSQLMPLYSEGENATIKVHKLTHKKWKHRRNRIRFNLLKKKITNKG